MEIDDELLSKLRADPVAEALRLVRSALDDLTLEAPDTTWQDHEYELLVSVCAVLTEMRDAELLNFTVNVAEPAGDINSDCKIMVGFVRAVETALSQQSIKAHYSGLRSRFRAALKNGFSYEFSSGDLKRIQELVNDLRSLIQQQAGLEEDHRQRLLRRLEKLQSEMHKKISDVDRFWGLIGDAGVVLGKLGADAKPIVDRIREIANIVWRTQASAEELPSGTKPPLIDHDVSAGTTEE